MKTVSCGFRLHGEVGGYLYRYDPATGNSDMYCFPGSGHWMRGVAVDRDRQCLGGQNRACVEPPFPATW